MSSETVSVSDWIALAKSQPVQTLPTPTPHSDEEDTQYRDVLVSLITSEELGTETNFNLLRLASPLSPSPAWADIALQWAQSQLPEQRLIDYCSAALSSSVFDSLPWIQALSRSADQPALRLVLQSYARSNEKGFLSSCDHAMQLSTTRLTTVQLLLDIILQQNYEPEDQASATLMARCAAHPILVTILRSLLFDTGNQLFPITLRCFLSILPYAPAAISSQVPLIMVVLGRAANWRDRPFVDHNSLQRDGVTWTPLPSPAQQWSICTSAQEEPLQLPANLQPTNITRLLFVAVYNAWPSNVLAFIRDPVAYINGKAIDPVYEIPWEDTWNQGTLASRVAPLLRNFHLHPSLVLFTSSSELADEKRWDKIDPPEFIAKSHMLAHSELLSGDKYDLLDGKPGVPLTIPDGSFTSSTEQQDAAKSDSLSQLQREVQLLRIEAAHTDRLRKQYLFHIGRLHRHTLRFNSDEAEIHSFVNRLKEQSKIIENLTAELALQKTEATQAHSKHVKWQDQLRDRLANNREERKAWQNEAAQIRGELSEALATVQRQKEEIAIIKNERFKLQGQLNEINPKISHIEDYEARMKQFTESQRLWDDDVRRCREAIEGAELWRGRCYKLETLIRSRETELERYSAAKIRPEQQTRPDLQTASHPSSSSQPVPDMEFYLNIADNAKKRAEGLERENLDLRVELERLRKGIAPEKHLEEGNRSFIWGA